MYTHLQIYKFRSSIKLSEIFYIRIFTVSLFSHQSIFHKTVYFTIKGR